MSTPFRPMLASAGLPVRWPVLASPKLDGVRCTVQDGVALSRSGRPIPNARVQALFGREELNGLDGELIVGPPTARDVFRRTQSGVMAADGEPSVTFWMFDLGGPAPYSARYERMRALIWEAHRHGPDWTDTLWSLRILDQTPIATPDDLWAYEARMLAAGYEGVMLRDPHGHYRHGRSTAADGALIKLKRHADAEARVVGVKRLVSRAGRTKDSLGALIVQDLATGQQFALGSGLNAAERLDLWADRHALPGRIARYRYQPGGTTGAPRFPVFAGFRDRCDL